MLLKYYNSYYQVLTRYFLSRYNAKSTKHIYTLRIYVYMVDVYMGSVGIYLRVNKKLLEEFTRVATSLGMNRSEAIRRAMETFIAIKSRESMTSRMRGLVKSKLSTKELEEAYLVSK